ncbi:fimbrial biogenesis chaperone [Citrobacter sedlakii]|uniref:fimbrial biogenesis chaperone n=1 Tax=Citrobacter sedlakii TaxID=67826 RepID=UPI00333C7E44
MRWLFLLTLFCLAILGLLSRYAESATLQVAPVTLNLNPHQRAAALYLTNTGDTPIHAQVRIYDWTQDDGKDVLTLTDDIVSSPAVASLEPGQQQLVRIVVLNPGLHAHEQSFRLQIDELPGLSAAGASHTGVHFLLRYSIPLFIAAEHNAALDDISQLACAQQETDIWCQNCGTSHIRLSNVQALANDGRPIETLPGLAGYVLAGQRFMLPFKRDHRRLLSALRAYLNENTEASLLKVHPAAVATAHDTPR